MVKLITRLVDIIWHFDVVCEGLILLFALVKVWCCPILLFDILSNGSKKLFLTIKLIFEKEFRIWGGPIDKGL